MNLVSNLGFNLGSKPGFEPGFKPGFKRGLESGFEPGLNPRLNLGLNLGWNLGSEPGFLGCCCSPPPPRSAGPWVVRTWVQPGLGRTVPKCRWASHAGTLFSCVTYQIGRTLTICVNVELKNSATNSNRHCSELVFRSRI